MTSVIEALQSTYFDTCDVFRVVESITDWGETVHQTQMVSLGIQCALSQNTRYNAKEDEFNNINHPYTLFMNATHDIRTGDEIIVTTSMNQVFKLKAAMPFKYGSHQEIPVKLEEKA